MRYYIGLISGTSLDGIDATIVDFHDNQTKLIASHCHTFPTLLHKKLSAFCNGIDTTIDHLGALDVEVGRLFAEATQQLLAQANIDYNDIIAIGSHGQTVYHQPQASTPFTLQIGDPNTIAALTGITTIADFRRKDIALGGEGAPFAPLFHRQMTHGQPRSAVVNIGGIANITCLTEDTTIGFDSGPGNRLLDLWCQQYHDQPFDRDGKWAASGNIDSTLLQKMLSDAYFHQAPPKSSGREYFHNDWLHHYLNQLDYALPPVDIQATLTALTAETIATAIKTNLSSPANVMVCGGGTHNQHLITLLTQQLTDYSVSSCAQFGWDPDWIEAILFAWLAKERLEQRNVDLCAITGATRPTILGGIYAP